eukprot:CAMPEP_0202361774 /NCGR_PEP_ID=MMETSP1126-20121109/14203_1 /ASSEMBLY_ACC=CAM_ASM_000457 /TAXON_ID=3047 /ORGANISM="Dunaliella tertiolecta, Strain CCMP1320" /LENGTH=206 /DNA_ID=CAMNT_0048955795 /DNA_START=1709 /DNA_END=2326 /DNA_ORIENTATION=+
MMLRADARLLTARGLPPLRQARRRVLTVNAKTGGTQGSRRRKIQAEREKKEKEKSSPLLYVKDGALILGDTVMLIATEASSERIPMFLAAEDGGGLSPDFISLTGVTVLCWLVAATILGDYKYVRPESDDWYQNLLGPVYIAVLNATLTWGLSALMSLAIFSYMLSANLLAAAPLLSDIRTEDTSPQLEVAIAILIIMTCWRGIAW